jgi:hypothetical protein
MRGEIEEDDNSMKSIVGKLMLGAALIGPTVLAQATAEPVANLERVNTTKEMISPKWQNGYFVSFDVPDGGAAPRIYVHDRAGKLIANAVVEIPNAIQTDLSDAAISQEGEIAVGGGARSSDGKASTFIAWLGKNGLVRTLVRTTPYTARRLCFADDGSLWALGFERDVTGMETWDYRALRQYSRDGAMVMSALPRSAFPQVRGVFANPDFAISGMSPLIYTPRTNEILRVSSADGSVIERRQGPAIGNGERVRNIVGIGTSAIIVSIRRTGGGVEVRRSANDGIGWTPIARLSSPVIGVDGKYLVTSNGSPDLSPRFSWIAID